MRQKIIENLLVTRPTRDDVLNLKVGDLAPDCFGKMRKVTEIYARGFDISGLAYVCYYTELVNGSISNSIKENEYVATVPLTAKYWRSENYPKID